MIHACLGFLSSHPLLPFPFELHLIHWQTAALSSVIYSFFFFKRSPFFVSMNFISLSILTILSLFYFLIYFIIFLPQTQLDFSFLYFPIVYQLLLCLILLLPPWFPCKHWSGPAISGPWNKTLCLSSHSYTSSLLYFYKYHIGYPLIQVQTLQVVFESFHYPP